MRAAVIENRVAWGARRPSAVASTSRRAGVGRGERKRRDAVAIGRIRIGSGAQQSVARHRDRWREQPSAAAWFRRARSPVSAASARPLKQHSHEESQQTIDRSRAVAEMLDWRSVFLRHGAPQIPDRRALGKLDVAMSLRGLRPTATIGSGSVAWRIRIAHARAVEDQRVIQQRSVAVFRRCAVFPETWRTMPT